MTILGIDYAFLPHPAPSAIRAASYTFACRYLSGSTAAGKNLTRSEADQLRAAGVDVVSNWEWQSGAALLGRARGVSDAEAAAAQHAAAGGPPGRPIYFSCDVDPRPFSSAQWSAVQGYYQGVASVIGLARTGAYGGFALIRRLFDAREIAWGWQTYAWSGGQWDARAQLRQVKNGITVGGADCDRDQAMAADFGQWGATPMEDNDMPQLSDTDYLALMQAAARINGAFTAGLTTYQVPLSKGVLTEASKLEAIRTALTGLSTPAVDTAALAHDIATELIADNANGLTPSDLDAVGARLKTVLDAKLTAAAAA